MRLLRLPGIERGNFRKAGYVGAVQLVKCLVLMVPVCVYLNALIV